VCHIGRRPAGATDSSERTGHAAQFLGHGNVRTDTARRAHARGSKGPATRSGGTRLESIALRPHSAHQAGGFIGAGSVLGSSPGAGFAAIFRASAIGPDDACCGDAEYVPCASHETRSRGRAVCGDGSCRSSSGCFHFGALALTPNPSPIAMGEGSLKSRGVARSHEIRRQASLPPAPRGRVPACGWRWG
jgi:hypothetical protein